MGNSHLQFDRRLHAIYDAKRHTARGYETYIDASGLIHVRARRRRKVLRHFPWGLLAGFVLLVTVFKAAAVLNIGLISYEEKRELLLAGSTLEYFGAMALIIDPITEQFIDLLKTVVTPT